MSADLESSEQQIVERLQRLFAVNFPAGVEVGIGDDAAVLTGIKNKLVATTDMAVEDIHFRTAWSSPFQIGAKLATANLADLFAMGATPKYLLVAAALPNKVAGDFIDELAKGIKSVADNFEVAVVGGDLSQAEKIALSITALGELEGKPITRGGAQVGDHIYVSELPGLSAAGLAILGRGLNRPRYVVEAHLNPKLVAPHELIKVATAMCDISDGISVDAANIARASKVNISFDKSLISAASAFSDLAELAKELNEDVFDWILNGGEDHFYLVAVNPIDASDELGVKIGEIVAGDGKVLLDNQEVKRAGYQHF
ncbi:MAG: thiamine-phosphate kinase [Actinomycetes bacterium]